MRTNVNSYYDLLQFGLNGTSFQQFVDKFKAKYNVPQTDGFVNDSEIQIGYTYEQLITSINVNTLPIYMDEQSEALDKSFGEFKIGSNKIPTQKHRYPIDVKQLREKMIMVQKFGEAALTSDTQNALMDLMFDSTDKLLGGNQNAMTHQRMQIVSTGGFEISLANNPRGITGLKFEFGIPSTNKDSLTGNDRWWTNSSHISTNEGSTSDPLKYLKDKAKKYRKLGFPSFHYEIAEDLLDDLLTHSKVISAVALSLYPLAQSDNLASIGANLTDEAKLAQIERIIRCKLVPKDSKAFVEKFDKEGKKVSVESIENFKVTNIALVPDMQLGTIKAVQPLALDNPAERTAWFDGGRTLLTTTYEHKAMFIESEMAKLCVPSMPQYMCVFEVTV